MSLRSRLDRALGLGPSDEPRPVTVEARRRAVVTPVVSTPGARVRLQTDGWSGELGRVSLMCHRRNIPVERTVGRDMLMLDGVEVTPRELGEALGWRL